MIAISTHRIKENECGIVFISIDSIGLNRKKSLLYVEEREVWDLAYRDLSFNSGIGVVSIDPRDIYHKSGNYILVSKPIVGPIDVRENWSKDGAELTNYFDKILSEAGI